MRIILFRLLAGVAVVLSCVGLLLGIRDGSIPGDMSVGDLGVIIGGVLIFPSIIAYAIAGPRAANWLLARGMKIMALPERIGEKLLNGRLEMPGEFTNAAPNSERTVVPEISAPGIEPSTSPAKNDRGHLEQ
ncbi:MAG: hypothetical protein ACT4O1_13590 [Gemmatimonadota bacterium]